MKVSRGEGRQLVNQRSKRSRKKALFFGIHPNSLSARMAKMVEKDPDLRERVKRNERQWLDDARSIERWGRQGFVARGLHEDDERFKSLWGDNADG